MKQLTDLLDPGSWYTKPHILAVDFDGTLVPHHSMSTIPVLKTFGFCKLARQQGWKIILFTCREGAHLVDAVEFCRKHGLEFDGVNENIVKFEPGLKGFGERKPYYDLLIDDRCYNLHIMDQFVNEEGEPHDRAGERSTQADISQS